MQRYVALIGAPDNPDHICAIQRFEAHVMAAMPDWSTAYRSSNALVIHTGQRLESATAYRLSGQRGVVIGTLFRGCSGNTNIPPIAFGTVETEKIATSRGAHLLMHYWGKYVLIMRDDDGATHHILRDPTAEMACFHATWQGMHLVFSDVSDIIENLPLRFSINWDYVVARLVSRKMLNTKCGLTGVTDIPGGTCVSLADAPSIDAKVLWRPKAFCLDPVEDEGEAQRQLRQTVQMAVDAWASCHPRAVLALSGGLDSSIVAGCLAQSPSRPTVTCWNYYIESTVDEAALIRNVDDKRRAKLRRVMGRADERDFARLVANRWNMPLLEYERRVSDMRMATVRNAPLAAVPTLYVNAGDLDTVETEIARQSQASAVFSGLAGDTVFYASLDPIAAIDHAYVHKLRSGYTKHLFESVALSRDSMWSVLGRSLKHGLFRAPDRSLKKGLSTHHLVKSSAAAEVKLDYVRHPWEVGLEDLPPGKRAHISGLVGALFYYHRYHRERVAESVSPLASQPVVELSLRIPSYVLLAGGVSRGLARRAFADTLPSDVARRIAKGSGGASLHRYVEGNMAFVRETLANGILARQGILDRRKLNEWLSKGQLYSSMEAMDVAICVAVEAWLQQWSSVSSARAAA
jgi:asparagine synthase (glutamine-hydrolysing)